MRRLSLFSRFVHQQAQRSVVVAVLCRNHLRSLAALDSDNVGKAGMIHTPQWHLLSDAEGCIMANEGKQPTGDKWGDDISEARKAELEAGLHAWDSGADHGDRTGPFDGETLTGADVLWLAARSLADSDDRQELADWAQRLQPQPKDVGVSLYLLRALNLQGAILDHAHLERANLLGAHLEKASFRGAHLEGANLWEAHLEGTTFNSGHLEGAELWKARLEEASFVAAHLEGANLWEAHLEQVNLFGAHLEQATLREAHLEGADLRGAQLQGANLWMSFLDRGTLLNGALLADAQHGSARVADVHWGEVNLAVVDWSRVKELGDERVPSQHNPQPQSSPPAPDQNIAKMSLRERRQARREAAAKQTFALVDAARAHRQLATVLRTQGIPDEADRFAYRAQLCQRQVLRRQHQYGPWLFAWLLALLAGYGYRLERILLTYVLTISAFAAVYFTMGVPDGFPHDTMPLVDAFQVSITAIHGRVFFEQLTLGSAVAWVAAAESIIGIVIEGVFTAMLVQRFFGSR
jgi:uncharacterized protein YjbI with pentapeptide repeats